ncbi:MAG: insulinase family protein [Alphaproteobacteria bacterium]|nr:insulinase family protein [Alphaproteobacteria bacterium]
MKTANKILLAGMLVFGLVSRANAMLFKASEFTLENGLRCVVIENHKAPIVKHMVWYKSGSIQEVADKSGSAHLLEHLMFRGTTDLADGKFNEIMDKNGISSNAFTSYDVTAYHEFSDISRLEVAMALEADRMRNLAFSDDAFQTEQKIVFQERKQVVENNPASAFTERLRMLMYGGTPYSRPITGYNEDILAITAEDIMALYRRYYAPNNALVVLSGDIDVATAKMLVEKYYGALKPEIVDNPEPKSVDDKFRETLEMSLPGIATPKFVVNYVLPRFGQLGAQLYAFDVLAEYLGHDENSVLYRRMVIQDKIAAHVGTAYHYATRGNTLFAVTMIPAADNAFSPAENIRKIDDVMTQAMADLDEEKLAKTKRKMLSGLVYVNDNPEDAAYWAGYALSVGMSLDELQQYEDKINQVTVQDVQSAFALLKQAARVDGILLPQQSADEESDEQKE